MSPEKEEDIDPAIRKIMEIPDDQELPDDALCDVMIRALESHQLLIRSSAVHQLVSLGKRNPSMAIPKILNALDPVIDYWTVRFGAIEALGEIADKTTVDPLIEYLKEDEDQDFRAMVAKQLGEMGEVAKTAGTALIETLADMKGTEIRENAAHALGQLNITNAVEPLIKALQGENDEYARRQMAWSLGELRNAKALSVLINTLNDSDKETRGNAAEALGKIKDSKTILPLLKASKDNDVDVQAKAIWALKEFTSNSIISEIEQSSEGDNLIAIQYYDEYLFNVDNDVISKRVKELRDPIILEYREELKKIIDQLTSCKIFVEENFSKLASMTVEELVNLSEKSIPPIESQIGSISLYKYRKYKWIENDLFFDIENVTNLYKESGIMISELRDNVQSLQKKKRKETQIESLQNSNIN
ncbi:MAG: HEAT repeat domain-containing protein [Candidatus Hodarchaeota archaeon]